MNYWRDEEKEQPEESLTPPFNWSFWMLWILATTLGWLLGWSLFGRLDVMGELGIGLAVGILQWLVLRSRIPDAYWWIVATAGGWAIGWMVVMFVVEPGSGVLAGALIGAVVGLTQWLVLRQHVPLADWWLVVSTLGWVVGLMAFLGPSLVGAVTGAATGVALERLLNLRQRKLMARKSSPTGGAS